MEFKEILKHCNPAAIFGARRVELTEGRGRGHRLVEVKTAAGLVATFSESKCLDIIDLSYKGVNLGFLSKNGLVAKNEPEADSFVKYWQGGFMATCGLRNTGGSCEVNGEFFPTHGSIGLTPAENIGVDVNEHEITITGTMRETALFGHCLEMRRKIIIPSSGAEISIKDTIKNLTPEEEAVFLLYHINFGFPFLSETLKLHLPDGEVRGRTTLAQEKIADHKKITAPIDNEPELVYFHSPSEKDVNVVLENCGFRVNINYDNTQLPVLAQWKCMKSGDYALGIEPGTSLIRGRKEELENGYDIKIPAFGKLEFGVNIKLRG